MPPPSHNLNMSGICSVCTGPSDSRRHVSICDTCVRTGYPLATCEAFLPYLRLASRGGGMHMFKITTYGPREEAHGIGRLMNRSYSAFKYGFIPEHTLVRKEANFRNNNISIDHLLKQTPLMCKAIIGDYLQNTRSSTKLPEIKKALVMRPLAYQIYIPK